MLPFCFCHFCRQTPRWQNQHGPSNQSLALCESSGRTQAFHFLSRDSTAGKLWEVHYGIFLITLVSWLLYGFLIMVVGGTGASSCRSSFLIMEDFVANLVFLFCGMAWVLFLETQLPNGYLSHWIFINKCLSVLNWLECVLFSATKC